MLTKDLGYLPPRPSSTNLRNTVRDSSSSSRSPSPAIGRTQGKREASQERPVAERRRSPSPSAGMLRPRRGTDRNKRARKDSPDRKPLPRRPLSPNAARPPRHFTPPVTNLAKRAEGDLTDGILYFLSILPQASGFQGELHR